MQQGAATHEGGYVGNSLTQEVWSRGILYNLVIGDYHMTMTSVGIAELKAKLSEHLRAVRRGSELTVYDRNEPIARMVPYASSGALVVRKPVRVYKTLREVKLPPPVKLNVDPVELLLEDRRNDR